jgi:DNA-binding NtrC family response regulator
MTPDTYKGIKKMNEEPSILIVDDEPQIVLSSSVTLRAAGYKNIFTAQDGADVMPLLAGHDLDVVVLDLSMPGKSGMELLAEINSDHPRVQTIVMTATNELETAVECIKSGAFDYLVKPVDKNRFISAVNKAIEMSALRDEVFSLKERFLRIGKSDTMENEGAFCSIITRDKEMRTVFHYVETVARSGQPILITGETGVGKELVAKAVHELSGRAGGFVPVNVAGLDDAMFSDALFGHKKGSFTGAEQSREGFIAQAAGGTLFLDEIGDVSEQSQVKLLRLLQEQKYYPIGSDVPRQCDARIVVATNNDLQELIRKGRFRKDLFYRLRAHHVHIPPLRERLDDVPILLEYFLEQAAKSLNKKVPSYTIELITLLKAYDYPGNVRELQAMVFDAVARHTSGILPLSSFKKIIDKDHHSLENCFPLIVKNSKILLSGPFPTLRETINSLITEALDRADGNQGIAASLLGITRQALNKRINKKPADAE